ncbi:hypothetical protein BHM03_00032534 [Ensete ventricosum]|nr:hypothetical protein BHM03_00032534 [Ensete ventricosum]
MDPGLLSWPFYRGLWGIEAGIGLFEGDLQPLVGSRLRRGPRMSAMWQAYTPVKGAAIIPTLTPHHSITWGHNSTRGVIFEEDPNPQPSPMGKGLCIASSGPSFDPPKVASLCEEAIKEPPALWRMVPLRKRGGDRGPGCRVVLAVNSSCLQAEEVGQCLAGARRRAEVETFQMALELRLALRRAKEAEVPMEEAWDVMNVIEDEVVETVAEANKQVEVL